MRSARNKTLYRHRAAGVEPGGARLTEASSQLIRHALKSPAEGLQPQTRARMEPYFGQNLSRVRVHSDPAATKSARAVSADAYTLGNDIVFGAGKYAPHTPGGEQLLAHEITHTLQQSGEARDLNGLSIAPANSPAEREADFASRGFPVREKPKPVSGKMLQRSVEGDVAGGAIGAGLGAGAGALLGGPIGAVAGGLIGGLAGLALGDILSADKRGLTSGEKGEAKLVFGESL